MKKILKISALFLVLAATFSCEDDEIPTANMVTPQNGPVLFTPSTGTAIVLTPDLNANPALTLAWEDAAYSVQTPITYNIEFAAKDTDFAAPYVVATTTQKSVTWTVEQLNVLAIDPAGLNLTPFVENEFEVRIVSGLGSGNSLAMASNAISIKLTPYTALDPELFFVGAPQAYYGLSAWDNATAIPMRYIGNGTTRVFEAYVKVAAGEGFKFIGQQGTWDNGNYGTIGGTQDGNLENSGGSSDIKVAESDGAGLYYVQVNLETMTYKFSKMNWGIIGSATGGWDNELPMAYSFADNQFTIAPSLSAGELKFRAANASQAIYGAGESWKFNVGVSDPTVVYNAAAGNFPIAAGSFNLGLVVNFDGTAVVSGL